MIAWRLPPDAGRLILPGLSLLLVLLLALKALDTLGLMLQFFTWPFQFDESESMIVAETLLLDRGANIYAPVTAEQFVAAPYPPVFYLLNWPVLHFTGPTFKAGRAISLAATLGAGLGVYLAVLWLSRDRAAGVLGGLAWMSLGLAGFWGALVKPDVLALLLGLAGLLVVMRRACEEGARVWWALPLFWAAFYTKQTAIAAAGAACVWLLLLRWREGLAFTSAYVAGALGGSLLLELWTGGYLYHQLTLHDLPWDAGLFLHFASGFLGAYWPLVGLGSAAMLALGVAVLWSWSKAAGGPAGLIKKVGSINEIQKPGSGLVAPAGLLLLGYWGAALLAATGAGTHGGNHNHMLEWAAAGCIGFGLLAHAARAAAGPWSRAAAFGLLLLPCLAAIPLSEPLFSPVPSLYARPRILGRELRMPTPQQQEGWSKVAQYTSNTSSAVYSHDVGLLLVTGKWKERIWSTDPFTQTHATYYGRWDESALLRAIRNKEFALIVLPYDQRTLGALLRLPDQGLGHVSQGIMRAVLDAYQIDQENVAFIYKPKE